MIRIIGGQWRGRKLPVLDVPGLRPTPDRVRETLFNWLQAHHMPNRCLDLFAGSGALGFEALSRGAAHVTFCEKHPKLANQIRTNCERLDCTAQVTVRHQDAKKLFSEDQPSYDLIFCDPPFRQEWADTGLVRIFEQGLLSANGLVYLETERDARVTLPDAWSILKQSQAGDVAFYLIGE